METSRHRLGSDFLFARPSLWSGIGRIFDLWGTFDAYNKSRTPVEADRRAMFLDWLIVGQDLQSAAAQVEEQASSDNARQGKLFEAASPR